MWSTAGTYLSEICQKLNYDELKLRLSEACFGIQQSVADQATDQWRVCLNACAIARRKHFEHNAMICCSTTVNNLLLNLPVHYSFFVSQLLTSHDFQSFSSGC